MYRPSQLEKKWNPESRKPCRAISDMTVASPKRGNTVARVRFRSSEPLADQGRRLPLTPGYEPDSGSSPVHLNQMWTPIIDEFAGGLETYRGAVHRLQALLARLSRLLSLQILWVASTCNNSPELQVSFSRRRRTRDAEYKRTRCGVQAQVMWSTSRSDAEYKLRSRFA